MCSLSNLPELRDHSLVDTNIPMNVLLKRMKPEVSMLSTSVIS